MQFTWQIPTRIIMEEDAVRAHAEEMLALGKKALILCTPSGKKNGALDDAVTACQKLGIAYTVSFDVEVNPTLPAIQRVCAAVHEDHPDFMIAIGGGSALDSAKAVAILLANPRMPAEDIFLLQYDHAPLPLVAIPTTCGTGSEVTAVSVLTDGEGKRSVCTPQIFPKIAFLDAKYLESLPVRILKDTVVDALCHAAEGYLAFDYPVSDMLACEFFRCLGACKEALLTEHCTPQDHKTLLYASMIAGLSIAVTGTVAVHTMSYPLTVLRGYAHGRACGVLLAEYARLCAPVRLEKIQTMLGLIGEKSIDGLKELLSILLGQNESFTDAEIEHFVSVCGKAAMAKKNPVPLNREMLIKLYQASLQ